MVTCFGNGLHVNFVEVTKHNIDKLKNNLLYFNYDTIYKDGKIRIKTYKQRINKDLNFFILFTPELNYFFIFDQAEKRYEAVMKFDITENFWNDILDNMPVGPKREWKLKQLFKTK